MAGGEDQGKPGSLHLSPEAQEGDRGIEGQRDRGKAPCCVPGAVLGAGDITLTKSCYGPDLWTTINVLTSGDCAVSISGAFLWPITRISVSLKSHSDHHGLHCRGQGRRPSICK